ncbi:PQQ-dependent sugar dehydrogenase [Nocardioides guangzhouensis]|uniref:PQQ-dependent sugar dehydrogenase n=1 Tax=Nocardioides guangzhouensis TaxID=2497878 RepID=A0A4Q4ZKK2_9ACTN|nr:PQQ-dependent sugar dehydrogenase [Nocardioides guangzhouensis]RYP88937.1 PQQ-dependent sugar dehydrogenase [Nocardioides guangzhouensis]
MRLAAALSFLTLTTVLTACTSDDQSSGRDPAPPAGPQSPAETASPSTSSSGTTTPTSPNRPPRVVRTIASGLAAPWGLDFLPDGTAVVTERDTRRVLTLRDGDVTEVGTIEAAAPQGEAGLLGVAASPDFDTDRTLFFYVSTAEDNRIVRARLAGGGLRPATPILTGIPNGFIHDGGRLEFGPDGYLYASTGETGTPEMAQDRDALGGKILRITADGKPAPGNPDPDSPVWSWGHRNVQGLAFDDTGQLWASEFGRNTFDELNRITKDANYGWPMFEGDGGAPDYTDPQVVWRTSEASPSGLAYARGNLWMASLRGERLWRVTVDGKRATKPTDFFVGDYGRLRTVEVAPDGNLWVTTSNRDGRGDPAATDDRILEVRP